MTKKPKSRLEKRARKKARDSFGSALDEIGWQPGERTLLAPGTIGPQLKARMNLEKATADIAAEQRFGGPSNKSTETEIMEEAARLVREARRAPNTARRFDQHDIADAAGLYIECCVAEGRLKSLSEVVLQISIDDVERKEFHVAVYELIRLYVEGARLTPHRSGDAAYERLRKPFIALHAGSWPPPVTEETII